MMKDIDAHLDEVLGIVETPQRDVAKTEKVKPLVNGQEDETDFQYARENLYNLIERGQDGLEELLEIAKQSQHPRESMFVNRPLQWRYHPWPFHRLHAKPRAPWRSMPQWWHRCLREPPALCPVPGGRNR